MKRILFLALLISVVARAEPTLQITSGPSSVQSGTSYYVEASCWDNMGGVSVTIYKNNNYFASSSGMSPVYAGGSTTDYGAQTVVYRIEAVNDYYQTDTIYLYVTITQPNNAPTIQWVTAPGSVPVNQNFTVQAKGMDQDGNLTSVSVWREWTPFAFNGGGNGYENTSDGNGYSQGSAGTVTFQAQAQDSNGATSAVISHTVTIYVPNQAPTITWINNPATAYVNQSFAIQARGDDANGNLAWVYVWKNGVPFALNGGGNGYQGYSDNNLASGAVPGTIQFSAQSGDSSSAVSSTIYHTVTIVNRAPNTPTITPSGTGLTNMGGGQYNIYNEPPNNQITVSSTMSDPDGNLTNHTIYYQRVTGANPDPGGWIALTNGTPSNASSSTVSTTQTMLTPGRWDFHTNGYDGYLSSSGASFTLYVYGQTNDSTFVSQVINGQTNPTALNLNNDQTVAATVTLRNSGQKPWNGDATPHKLGSQTPADNTNWGLNRVALPASTINPSPQSGDTAVFVFNITAPHKPGPYTFQWKMIEEGFDWFGASSPAVTVTVIDTIDPTTPANLRSPGKTHNSVSLAWDAATDNSESVSYAVYRGATQVGTTTNLSFTDTGLSPTTAYTYTVKAFDAAGRFSAASNAVNVTTNADPYADDDADGIPNVWETAHGLNPNSPNDGMLDPDGDGLTNVAEYNLDKNPTSYDAGAGTLGGTVPSGWPNSPGSSTYAVGLTTGSLAVDKQGAANYTIPLWVVPGTAGMQPQLALNYSSQAGAGWLGYGWSLSGLSAITRGPQTMALDGNITGVNFTASDRFYLDGQRLIAVSGTYGDNGTEYRTELDSISKIVSYNSAGTGPAWFKVWTKSGLIIELGNTTDSAVDAQGKSEKASWAVNKISDTSGNCMEFVYSENTSTGEHRIDRINYTRNDAGSLSHYASVRFTYENRSDTFSGYVAGSKVSRTQRIKNIGMYYGETKVREYVADYIERANTGRSILTTLHEKDGGGAEYPPLAFEYDEAPATGVWDQSLSTTWAPPAIMGEQGQQPKGTGFVDLNGDGRPDFVQAHQNSSGQWLDGGPQAWINDPVSGWVSASGYNPPAPLAKDGTVGAYVRFVDLNGDGLVDFFNLNNGYAYLNTPGTGWVYSSDWSFPAVSLSESDAKQALLDVLYDNNNNLNDVTVTNIIVDSSSNGNFADVNGDGRPDFVGGFTTYKVDGRGNNGKATLGAQGSDPNIPYAPFIEPDGWRNTGSGWARETAYGGGLSSIKGARLADVNADGFLDSVQNWYGSGTTLTQLYLGNGAGWTNMGTSHALIPPILLNAGTTGNENAPVGTEMADLNGDGLIDLIARNDSAGTSLNSAYLGTGTGWVSASAYLSPLEMTHDNTPQGVALLDLNSDGLVDLVQGLDSYTRVVRFGTGNGWSSDVSAYHLVRQIYQPNIGYNGTDFVDLNADGAMDQVWNWKPTGGSAVSGVALNNAKPADRLKKITNGFGVAAQITYAPLTERSGSSYTVYEKGSNSLTDTMNVIGPIYVVKTVSHDDGTFNVYGLPNQYTLNYRYGGLRSHRLRGSVGFEWVQSADSRTNIVTKTTYKQEYPYIGMVASTETTSGATVLNSSGITYYDKNTTGSVRLPYAHIVTQTTNDLNGAAISSSTTTSQIDAYGSVTSIVVDTGDGFTKTTTNVYGQDDVSSGRWLLGRLTRSTVVSAATGKTSITRTSSFTYYTPSGLLESETVEPDVATLRLTTTYGYDAFGNKQSSTVSGLAISVNTNGDLATGSAVSRSTQMSYDSQGRFPISTTNHLGHTVTFDEYDQGLGVLKRMSDINYLETSWTYDGFGRQTRETRADQTYTLTTYGWAGTNAPAGSTYFVETASYLGEGANAVRIAAPQLNFYDNFGRVRWALAINGDGRIAYQQTAYDNRGRAYARSNPYFLNDPVYWTQTTSYDELNRPLSVNTPDDNASYVTTGYGYNGRVTTVTDPLNRVARSTVNSQGWLVEAVRNNAGGTNERSVVTHDYDVLGNLTSTVADGVTTTLAYDLRGRKTSMADPDMGTWQYRYNVFGELIWQKDAKSQITTMVYDSLGRLTSRVEAEGTTTWTYDTSPTKGLGKLYTISAPGNYGETHTYDSYGRPARVARTIDGNTYEIDAGYDSASRLLKTTYPTVNGTRFATRQVYNTFGTLKEIRTYLASDDGKPNSQLQGRVHWMADHFAVTGQVDGEMYGNGLANDRVYSAKTGRLLGASIDKGRVTDVPYALQQMVYTHDAVGNVVTRADQAVGRGESFAYDGLDRLTTHTIVTGAGTSVSATYDAKGNLASKSNVGTYAYGSGAGPHAVTGVSGGPLGTQTYAYDANGNMTGGYGRTITWTSFNQAASIAKGGYSSTFSFGANHERVKHVSHLETTIYVGAMFEQVTPAGGGVVAYKHYLMAPTGRVAVYTDRSDLTRDTRYFHTDGLGSITAVTDEKGAVVKRFAFDAWGQRIDPSTGNTITGSTAAGFRRGYTDHEQLDDLGLVHMNGRVYDPVLGRFLSADPFIDGVTDGQSFNRYSYLNNDPLGGVDPSGYFKFKDAVKIVAVVAAAYFTAGYALYLSGGITGVAAGTTATFSNALAALAGTGGFGVTLGGAIAAGTGAGFASGFAGSLLNGGSIGDAFKAGVIGGVIGGITGGLTYGIGGSNLNYFERAGAHGLVSGAAETAQGGQFRHGFYAGLATAVASPAIDMAPRQARFVAAAIVGGTASAVGGGKFANGAVSGAFQYLLNDSQQHQQQAASSATSSTESATVYVWDFQGKDVAWGHASMELSDGTYVSFWPGGNRDYKKGQSKNLYTAEEIPNQTHADVIRLEGKAPDHAITVTNVNTAAVKTWWAKWQAEKQWSTLSSNCSTTVYEGLRAGGKPTQYKAVWKPSDVLEYANKNK